MVIYCTTTLDRFSQHPISPNFNINFRTIHPELPIPSGYDHAYFLLVLHSSALICFWALPTLFSNSKFFLEVDLDCIFSFKRSLEVFDRVKIW
jgi:hypothetical protein